MGLFEKEDLEASAVPSRQSSSQLSHANWLAMLVLKKGNVSLYLKRIFGVSAAGLAVLGINLVPVDLESIGAPLATGPAIVTTASLNGQDADIIFDPHTHTKFSDGQLTPAELVDLARSAGCNAIAITDHSATGGTASNRQLESFEALRRANADFLLFGGVEVGMPSYGSREHVNLIVDPAVERELLPRLRNAAEESNSGKQVRWRKRKVDANFLRLAADYHRRGDNFVMIYNHPSRKDLKTSENYDDITRWNVQAPLIIGFEGGPGHQNAPEPGSYKEPIFTADRWDPVVEKVGGTWDRLLSEGHQLWGAIASSDYHNNNLDKAPCTFSRTHVAARELGYQAVLDALRSGTFWAEHGQILDQLSLSAEIKGLAQTVFPGSVIDLGRGERGENRSILAQVSIIRGAGSVGAPLQVEFIGNCRTGKTELLAVEPLDSESTNATAAIEPTSPGADNRSCFIRARVRREMGPEPDLMAYTNHIRFILR